MCYDSNRYEWARRAVRMQEEQLRAEQREAAEKEARKKAKGEKEQGRGFPWNWFPAFLR